MSEPSPVVDPSWPPPYVDERARRDHSALVRDAAWIVGGMTLLGVLCGVLWAQAVPDVLLTRTETGVGQDELSLSRVYSLDGWFMAIGAAGGLLAGLLAGFLRRRDALATLALVVLGCVIAAFLMRATGGLVGPSDPTSALADAEIGTQLPGQLSLSDVSSYLAWPVGTFFGLLIPLLVLPDRSSSKTPDEHPPAPLI